MNNHKTFGEYFIVFYFPVQIARPFFNFSFFFRVHTVCVSDVIELKIIKTIYELNVKIL